MMCIASWRRKEVLSAEEPSETENLGSLMKELHAGEAPAEHRPCEALGEPTASRSEV